MASASTTRVSGTSPYVTLTVTESSRTDTTLTLSYSLKYYASSAASTSVAKSYSIVIDGSTVKSGTYNINGKTGWYTIASGTKTITRGTSTKSITCSASFSFNLTWSGTAMGVKSCSLTYSIPYRSAYAIKFNANGGSGAPATQNKWHDIATTLSSTKPTRTGYTFAGWGTSASDTTVDYAAGAKYTSNKSITLYAIWTPYTYAVTYNANGGTGAPSSQTKSYGTTLKLSSVEPTRTNYMFLGWGTSASATTVAYEPGSNYTANAALTLYAVWELNYVKPRITSFSVARCDSAGAASDDGTYALVKFDWVCDRTVSSITIEYIDSASHSTSTSVSASGTSGSVSKIIGNGALSNEATYSIRVTVADTLSYSSSVKTLSGIKLIIDCLNGGNGVSFGKPAELPGVADFGFEVLFRNGIKYMLLEIDTDFNDVRAPGFYAGFDIASNNYGNCPLSDGSFTMEVAAAGGHGQVRQYIYECDKLIPEKFERYYYASSGWGAWIKLSPTSLAQIMHYTPSVVNTYELVGSIVIPAYKFYTITARGMFNNASCKGVIIGENDSNYRHSLAAAINEDTTVHFPSCTYSGYTGNAAKTFYIWGKWAGTNENTVQISGFYLPY